MTLSKVKYQLYCTLKNKHTHTKSENDILEALTRDAEIIAELKLEEWRNRKCGMRVYRNVDNSSSGVCYVCSMNSATTYLLTIGDIGKIICPSCKGNLTSDIEKINRDFDGL